MHSACAARLRTIDSSAICSICGLRSRSMASCYRATIAAMPAFHPFADTLASALRTLVLLGVVSALAGLPAAAIARFRGDGAPGWLAFLAGPAITVHGLNLAFFAVLVLWIA